MENTASKMEYIIPSPIRDASIEFMTNYRNVIEIIEPLNSRGDDFIDRTMFSMRKNRRESRTHDFGYMKNGFFLRDPEGIFVYTVMALQQPSLPGLLLMKRFSDKKYNGVDILSKMNIEELGQIVELFRESIPRLKAHELGDHGKDYYNMAIDGDENSKIPMKLFGLFARYAYLLIEKKQLAMDIHGIDGIEPSITPVINRIDFDDGIKRKRDIIDFDDDWEIEIEIPRNSLKRTRF